MADIPCTLWLAMSNEQAFIAAMLTALQNIETAIDDCCLGGGGGGGGGGGNTFETVTWVPLATIDTGAPTDITNYTQLMTDANLKKYIQVINGTGENINLSFDGGVGTHVLVTAGGSFTVQLGASFNVMPTNIFVKAADPLAVPITGSITASAYY